VLSLHVRTTDEALGWLDRVAAIQGDLELVLGLCTEAWDLGFAEKPENPPLRLLAVFHADARTEGDQPSTPAGTLSCCLIRTEASGTKLPSPEVYSP
jgi:hypothetical protein